MLDRVPTKPNRYAVYDDAHNFLRYEYHERADEPTQVGDALNKANLLPDAVATALGLTGNPQVADALAKLNTLVDTAQTTANGRALVAIGSYKGTGTYGSGNRNSLTFSFVPKVLLIFGISEYDIILAMVNPGGLAYSFFSDDSIGHPNTVTWGTTVQWYGPTQMHQFNMDGRVYRFVAIG